MMTYSIYFSAYPGLLGMIAMFFFGNLGPITVYIIHEVSRFGFIVGLGGISVLYILASVMISNIR